ncbi:MAG TPA: hypothetical protein VGG22_15150 [Candidatus Baltobacteraceae bacterium]|jgi:hypothetical protein
MDRIVAYLTADAKIKLEADRKRAEELAKTTPRCDNPYAHDAPGGHNCGWRNGRVIPKEDAWLDTWLYNEGDAERFVMKHYGINPYPPAPTIEYNQANQRLHERNKSRLRRFWDRYSQWIIVLGILAALMIFGRQR